MKSLNILLIAAAFAIAKPQSDIATPGPFQTGLGKVYDRYLNIQQALANDNHQKARTAADSFSVSLKRIPSKGLDSAAKSHWDSSSASMMKMVHSLASSRDIDALRSNFKGLTPLVVEAIEKFGMKSASAAYLFHCPMVKADWLQKDKAAANPFLGQSMPECGSLVREIKTN